MLLREILPDFSMSQSTDLYIMAPQLLWIGLGNIGRGACKMLVEKGPLDKPLLVYNRTSSRSDQLARELPGKVQAMQSLLEAVAQADIIFSCLSNDATVEETYCAIITSGNIKDKMFVSCETIDPDTADKVASLVTDVGASFVSCPVVGPPAAAATGQLLCIPAGPKSAIERVRPYLTGVIGRAEISFEDKPCGTALKLKIVGNTCIMNMACQLAEVFTLAEKTEVGTEAMKKWVDVMFGDAYASYADRMLSGTYWREEPLGSVAMGIKDTAHALHLVEASGTKIKNAETVMRYLRAVGEYSRGGDKGDIAGMYGVVRMNSGLKFENGE
ncbi:hypothetical protein G7Y89_g12600 [Cudoniella acicularis]|uniref:6-phosphogluconate dehydrogenase NADP-binding domain-containing protein n=1 Tax=Cudoniella acicularis TaxID=354080 RepID=A0A8H4RBI4_9HELO|nr:hypothetical protein G7Y89_g12600 [Cudoniella acicularis]